MDVACMVSVRRHLAASAAQRRIVQALSAQVVGELGNAARVLQSVVLSHCGLRCSIPVRTLRGPPANMQCQVYRGSGGSGGTACKMRVRSRSTHDLRSASVPPVSARNFVSLPRGCRTGVLEGMNWLVNTLKTGAREVAPVV